MNHLLTIDEGSLKQQPPTPPVAPEGKLEGAADLATDLATEAKKYKTAEEFVDSVRDRGLEKSLDKYRKERILPDKSGYYYHVAPDSYDGGDILSAEKIGMTVEEYLEKWPDLLGDLEDYYQVSLFNSIEEALSFNRDYFGDKGKILKIKLNEYHIPRANYEGYASVRDVSSSEIVGEAEVQNLPQLTDIWNKATAPSQPATPAKPVKVKEPWEMTKPQTMICPSNRRRPRP